MRVALILFILVPIAELFVLIQVGSRIGGLATIGLVFLTAIIGLALLRRQGFSTLMRANERMQQGEVPAREMAEGVFLAVGGALLLTPGFITDALGLACLIPGLRRFLLSRVFGRWQIVQARRFNGEFGGRPPPSHAPHRHESPQKLNENKPRHTIEGEYRRDD